MKKFDKIRRIGDRENAGILESEDDALYLQEKMDGANFRFTLAANVEGVNARQPNQELVFGSRNCIYKYDKDTNKSFRHAVEYVKQEIDRTAMLNLAKDYGGVTVFGEAMHPHTLEYDWDEVPSFLGFDIWSHDEERYLDPFVVESRMETLDLPFVPTIPLNEWEPSDDIPRSEYRDGPAEGVVIKNSTTGQRAKVRSEEFKEVHGGPTGGDEEYDGDDSIPLARKFTTEARVKKHIHKAENVGRTVGMEDMEWFWELVFEDIIEEEYDEIFLGNYQIDTKDFRSEVASLTANYLQNYLSRPDNSVLNDT